MLRIPIVTAVPFLLAAVLAAQSGVSQAGAAQARLFAERGLIPPPATFVVADILNERQHDLPLPGRGASLALDLRWCRAPDPAGAATAILQVGLATGTVPDPAALRPVNVALAIDCSGSMADDEKLERVRAALLTFADQLRPSDCVALIAWSDDARMVRRSQPVGDRQQLRQSIRELRAGGSTNLHGGLMCALAEVARTRIAGGTNRVILLTDGIANRGVTDPKAIADDAALLSAAGIDVTTIGFGQDVQADLLRQIAAAGRSAFHFVAGHEDIAKLFVREVQSLLSPVARRLRLTLEVDPDLRVVRVLGPQSRRDDGLALSLEDMNHQASQVVLVEVAVRAAPVGKRRFPVRALLSWVDAQSGEDCSLTRVASLDAGDRQPAGDVEVLRNLAIARLAVALRAMAEESQEGRSGAARRVLIEALASASRDPQVCTHPDVAKVMATAARYRDVLSHGDAGSTDR